MVGWGGKRDGAGRKLNPLKSAKIAAELIERNKLMHGDANCPTPLEFMLGVLWDDDQPFDVRFDAAKTAAPYIHPRLQAVAVSSPDDNRVIIELRDFSKRPVQSGDTIEPPSLALEDATEIAMNVIEAQIEAEDQEQEAN